MLCWHGRRGPRMLLMTHASPHQSGMDPRETRVVLLDWEIARKAHVFPGSPDRLSSSYESRKDP
jgi:hypothetical protein